MSVAPIFATKFIAARAHLVWAGGLIGLLTLQGCASSGVNVGVSVPIGRAGGVGVSVGSGGTIGVGVGVGGRGGSVSVGTSMPIPKQGETKTDEKKADEKTSGTSAQKTEETK
jgi:hypothetical protein